MTDLNQYDFVIYGATGFTGKLVVEYVIDQYSNNDDISWAIAGRNIEKLGRPILIKICLLFEHLLSLPGP